MHKKYGPEGFAAVSVNLGDPADPETRARVHAFLKKKEANMTNVIALGDPDDWYKALDAGALPLVYVFDRDNRRVKKLEGEAVKYSEIEQEVVRLLKK
jgi:hypothetical protein